MALLSQHKPPESDGVALPSKDHVPRASSHIARHPLLPLCRWTLQDLGPVSGLMAKSCSQAPLQYRRVETQAHLAGNAVQWVPRMAVCPRPHCALGWACRLGLASLPPKVQVRLGRDLGPLGFLVTWESMWQAPSSCLTVLLGVRGAGDLQFLITARNPLNTPGANLLGFHRLEKCLWNIISGKARQTLQEKGGGNSHPQESQGTLTWALGFGR